MRINIFWAVFFSATTLSALSSNADQIDAFCDLSADYGTQAGWMYMRDYSNNKKENDAIKYKILNSASESIRNITNNNSKLTAMLMISVESFLKTVDNDFSRNGIYKPDESLKSSFLKNWREGEYRKCIEIMSAQVK